MRIKNDAYQTPVECVEKILPYIDFRGDMTFLEPCAGDGNILLQITPLVKHAGLCEIDPDAQFPGEDYLKADIGHRDLIITNPPFNLAIEFLGKSLLEADTVIYLLQLNFMAPASRKDFFNLNKPTHLFPLSKRPAFISICKNAVCHKEHKEKYARDNKDPCIHCGGKTKNQTDMRDYAWYCWDKGNRIKTNEWLTVL